MINTLHIKNIGIIDDISINLNEGFNVLTGGTGAGKTLIIGSLQILAGGRFSKEMMRNGQKSSFVEMSMDLPNRGYEDDMVIISREITSNGKNICKINGRLVTVSELKEFMHHILDIHGQNDNQSILDTNTHIALLDGYARNEIEKVKKEYTIVYEEYLNIKKALIENYGDDKEKQRKLDLLNYQVTEIEEAHLKINEEKELEEKRKWMLASEKIAQNLEEAENQINAYAIDSINIAIKSLEQIERYHKEYPIIITRLKNSYYEIQEAARDISEFNKDVEFHEEEQMKVEERLDLIYSLKRKYGNTIEEILDYQESVKQEIFEIENLEAYITNLKKKLEETEEKMQQLAKKMHEVRKKYARELSEEINQELQELEMKNASFHIQIGALEEGKYNSNGQDIIEFMITTNIGEKAKPLVKIASGGEMSRIMLAIKNVLADIDQIPVLVFDEIDTGISGIAANSTGEKIKKIARTHQVICVTHLASIAAKGDYHYYICKEVDNGQTKTRVTQLNDEEKIKEIARIASGNITEMSMRHAKELIEAGEKIA